MIWTCVLIFICGAVYEITSTYWVSSVEKLHPLKAGVWSFIQAVVMLTGIEKSIHNLPAAASFALGYATGSIVGVWLQKVNTPE